MAVKTLDSEKIGNESNHRVKCERSRGSRGGEKE